jgi:hypothetical protein
MIAIGRRTLGSAIRAAPSGAGGFPSGITVFRTVISTAARPFISLLGDSTVQFTENSGMAARPLPRCNV